MGNVYLISAGSYSDYAVCFLFEINESIDEATLKEYWLEAIRRKTEYYDRKLELVANYLGIGKQKMMYDYFKVFNTEEVNDAMKKAAYNRLSETDFLQCILEEHGAKMLRYKEYNVDYLE